MKIFYGVQGTGNGHITRARVMAKELQAAGMEVQYQFSGRPADKYFDMEIFGDYQTRAGLTFNINKGSINMFKTVLEARPVNFVNDIKSLDLSSYDLVISDFEPITAWAAKRHKKTVIGIGHQYAFKYKIPRQQHDPMAEQVLKHFAPATIGIGLHWHHFDQPILPPIIETAELAPTIKNKIVVYLPFEDTNDVIKLLAPFTEYTFHVYTPDSVDTKLDHITCYPLSRDGFQQDLRNCDGIISNSGFELASESLHLGKKILARPIHGQMEQAANAAALLALGYGSVMTELDRDIVERWLHEAHNVHVSYPNVAHILVDWIQRGMPEIDQEFISGVWDRVNVERRNPSLATSELKFA
jgi:uncharacterized protein (TIGR00661 family)